MAINSRKALAKVNKIETILGEAGREMKQTAFYMAGLSTLLAGALWAVQMGAAYAQVPPTPQNLTPQLSTPRAGAAPLPAPVSAAPVSATAPSSTAAQPALTTPRSGAQPAATMAILPENLQTDTLTVADIQGKLDATPDDLSFMLNRLRDLDLGRSVIQHEGAALGGAGARGLGG